MLTLSNILTLFRIDVLFLSVSAQQGGLAFLLLLFVGVLVVDLNVEIPELPTHLGLLEELVLLFFSFGGVGFAILRFFRRLCLGRVFFRNLLSPETFEGLDDFFDVIADIVALSRRALENGVKRQDGLVVFFVLQVGDDFASKHEEAARHLRDVFFFVAFFNIGLIFIQEFDHCTWLFANFSEFFNDFLFAAIVRNLKCSVDNVLYEEINLILLFLECIRQWLRFPVLQVKILLHLNFVRVLARLVGIVMEIFGLEEHVASHELVQIIVQFSVIGMSAPGDESALLGKNGERQALTLKVQQQVLALTFGIVELFVFTLLFDKQVIVGEISTFRSRFCGCIEFFERFLSRVSIRNFLIRLLDDGNGNDLEFTKRFIYQRLPVDDFIRCSARLVLGTSTVDFSSHFTKFGSFFVFAYHLVFDEFDSFFVIFFLVELPEVDKRHFFTSVVILYDTAGGGFGLILCKK